MFAWKLCLSTCWDLLLSDDITGVRKFVSAFCTYTALRLILFIIALPFLQKSALFLYPVIPLAVVCVVFTLLRINLSLLMLKFRL